MRIAHMGIKGLPSRFGADRAVENIVDELAGQHTISVYAGRAFFPARRRFEHFRQIYVPSLPGKHLRMATVMICAALHALLFGRYDVIHLHNLETGFVVPLLRLRFRVVVTSHGIASEVDKWGAMARRVMRRIERNALASAHAVTAVSQPQAAQYAAQCGREVRWIPNGIRSPLPCDRLRAETVLREAGAPREGFLLFLAGRIIPMKGCHLLLEAARRGRTGVPIVVVGECEALPDYTRQLRESATPEVTFIGFQEDPATLFGIAACARLFVFPSTVEAMSMALLEMASLGVPALVSDIPANRAVLNEEQVTFFRSGDSDDLAARLQSCLADPGGIAAKALAAQSHVRAVFDWPTIAAQYDQVYRAVMAR